MFPWVQVNYHFQIRISRLAPAAHVAFGSPPARATLQFSGPVIPLYKLMRRGDACVAPTACLRAGLIVCVKMNHRILVGPRFSDAMVRALVEFPSGQAPVARGEAGVGRGAEPIAGGASFATVAYRRIAAPLGS